MKAGFKGVPAPVTVQPVNSGGLPVRLSGVDEAVTLARAASKTGTGKGGGKTAPGGSIINLPRTNPPPAITKGGGTATGQNWDTVPRGPDGTPRITIDQGFGHIGETFGGLVTQTVDAVGGAVSQLIPQQVADWFGMDAEDLAPPPAAASGVPILPLVIIGGLILFLVFKG